MDFLSDNKVLITGIEGFTGVYLKKYLQEKGFEIFGIANKETNDKAVFKCDITNKEAVLAVFKEIKPNYVIHLAAISFVAHKNLLEIYNVNILGTQNILDACIEIKSSLKKIVLASSATVYGNQDLYHLDESMCPNPINHYGISKFAMEQLAKNYFDILPILITRPFNYTAPEQNINFVIPKIAKAFINKEARLELGNTNTFREYNSITLVCESYFKLMISNLQSDIFNICSGKTHSIDEIIKLFAKITNHNIIIEKNDSFVRNNEIAKLSGNPEKLEKNISIKTKNNIQEIINDFLKFNKI